MFGFKQWQPKKEEIHKELFKLFDKKFVSKRKNFNSFCCWRTRIREGKYGEFLNQKLGYII